MLIRSSHRIRLCFVSSMKFSRFMFQGRALRTKYCYDRCASTRIEASPQAPSVLHRKEVIQPLVLERLPCYDFTPIIGPTLDSCLLKGYLTGFGCYQLSWGDGRCVQGPGTYSPRHADSRLLAIPTSCRRIAACDPNWGRVSGICSTSRLRCPLLPTIVVRV